MGLTTNDNDKTRQSPLRLFLIIGGILKPWKGEAHSSVPPACRPV